MPDEIKPIRATRRVLTALLTGAGNLGGYTIWHLTGGSSGRVHVALARLERAGWVTSEWETPEPSERPRRRFYRLTPDGRARALALLHLEEGNEPR